MSWQHRSAPGPRDKGMAVTSLILGIISIPTVGLVFVGGIISLVLGILALSKAQREPHRYGGKGLAIGGIVTSILSLIIAGLAVLAIPRWLTARQAAHELAALNSVQTISQAQVLYSLTRGRGKYANLEMLGAEGFIDQALASGHKGGYVFNCTSVDIKGLRPMFDVTAKPESTGTMGTGNLSYYTNETLAAAVYQMEGGEPPTATAQDRVPRNGSPVLD